MKLNIRPYTSGPIGGWLAQGLCCNILSELAPPPRQFPWPDTLTAEAEVLEKYLRSHSCQWLRALLQAEPSTPHSLILFYSLILALLSPLESTPQSICSIFGFDCIPICCLSLSCLLHTYTQDLSLGSYSFEREGCLDTADWPKST